MSTEEAEKVFINSYQFNHAIESLRASRVVNFNQIAQSVRTRLKQLCDHLLEVFIEDSIQQSALKMWQKVDRDGQTHWYVRDPDTGKTIAFLSEAEMLSWVDRPNSRNHW